MRTGTKKRERAFGDPDEAHAVVDAAWSKASLHMVVGFRVLV